MVNLRIEKKHLCHVVALFLFVLATSCGIEDNKGSDSEIRKIELEPKYQLFENVTTLANCSGPDIKYQTEVHSSKDKYTYFKQEYAASENNYEVVILDEQTGYTLNEKGQREDTLSRETIEAIRSHEFHKIHMFPGEYFKNIKFEEEKAYQGDISESYTATDLLGNHVSLYYDRKKKLLKGFTLRNPVDPTEQIEIFYKEWIDSPFGKLAKKVEIIQGGKDVYHFDFEKVTVNDEDFEKK